MKRPFLSQGELEIRARRIIPAHRVSHGSTAWSAVNEFRQPQDGALESVSRVADIGVRMQRGPTEGMAGNAVSSEPEDARLTGGTRSLMRRLMGLNIAARNPSRGPQIVPEKRLA